MSNHVHLIAVPEREDSLARAFGRTHADYARWLHIRQRQTGHLWQNRFYSCPLDHGHCWAALRYWNAILCEPEWLKPPGSGRGPTSAHVSAIDGTGFLDLQEWQTCWTATLWKQAMENGVGEALLVERIRLATRTGRPLGTREFAAALEQAMGRSLLPAKRGRKPKEHSVAGLLCAKG